MIRSMTAFARTVGDQSDTSLVWELRSVNHRYLDITVRLPDELRNLEPLVREKVAAKLGRGKLECHLRYDRAASESDVLHVDQDRLTAVLSACPGGGKAVSRSQFASNHGFAALAWCGHGS